MKKTQTHFISQNRHTKFGARMLRFWICSPLTSIVDINARLDAIDDLEKIIHSDGINFFSFLKKLPDLERLLNRIHTQGLKHKNDHPDSRAQMFENYDTKKVLNLVKVMDGLHSITRFMKKVDEKGFVSSMKSSILRKILTPIPQKGSFPDIETILTRFAKGFNVNEARTGNILPRDDGSDEDYSDVCQRIRDTESLFNDILKKESAFFRKQLRFVHSGKQKYLLEIPTSTFDTKKEAAEGDKYVFKGITKTCKKFSTKELQALLSQLKQQEDERDELLKDHKRKLFALFSKDIHEWMSAIKQICILDCLLSLTLSKMELQSVTKITRPIFLKQDDPVMEIKEGKHPILAKISNCNLIANDVTLGNQVTIVTGPNMGGKSTLFRKCGTVGIMAMIGCYVTASSVKMTPIDRIFTRLGSKGMCVRLIYKEGENEQ